MAILIQERGTTSRWLFTGTFHFQKSKSSILPVIEEKKQDYRYLEYTKALEYLDKTIEENLVSEVTKVLKQTRNVIVAKLGN